MSIILIALGFILIIINYKALKNDNKSEFAEIYHNTDKITKDYDLELMAIRKDMAESILDLQKEIEELKSMINSSKVVKDNSKTLDIVIDNEVTIQLEDEKAITNDNDNDKVTIIKNMIIDGYTDDEICTKMQIGKGEVLLIRGLFK